MLLPGVLNSCLKWSLSLFVSSLKYLKCFYENASISKGWYQTLGILLLMYVTFNKTHIHIHKNTFILASFISFVILKLMRKFSPFSYLY